MGILLFSFHFVATDSRYVLIGTDTDESILAIKIDISVWWFQAWMRYWRWSYFEIYGNDWTRKCFHRIVIKIIIIIILENFSWPCPSQTFLGVAAIAHDVLLSYGNAISIASQISPVRNSYKRMIHEKWPSDALMTFQYSIGVNQIPIMQPFWSMNCRIISLFRKIWH